jgi:hypothetical protein
MLLLGSGAFEHGMIEQMTLAEFRPQTPARHGRVVSSVADSEGFTAMTGTFEACNDFFAAEVAGNAQGDRAAHCARRAPASGAEPRAR